jgi:glyoxylase-like metal-dependent hydrolase (beta-lactamase superfamily II)
LVHYALPGWLQRRNGRTLPLFVQGEIEMHKLFTTLIVSALLATGAVAQDAKRSITKIAGDVYRFQNNFHYNIFVVTPEGVVVTDPINKEAAEWLKAEIGKITDQPIKYLIYSHSHGDHASGGAVFADTAEVIAHKNAPEAIDGVAPKTRFDVTHTVEIGGKIIELTWLGKGHGEDLTAMVVRPENVAFVVDAVSVNLLPFKDFPGADVGGIIEQIKTVEGLDFEILAPGHGAKGAKTDVAAHRDYVEKLLASVKEGLKGGKTVDDLVTELTLDEYAEWGLFKDWREPNIRGMARWLKESGGI